MKKIILALAVLALLAGAVAGYIFAIKGRQVVPPFVVVAPAQTHATPLPKPSPTLPPATPTPAPARLVIGGIYPLLREFALTNGSGVMRVPAGTMVTLVADEGDLLRVTDSTRELEVTRDFLVPVEGGAHSQANLAPPGVYFLLKHIGVTTDSGIIGIEPGARLTLLGENGNMLHVTDGTNELDVDKSSVTNDLTVARGLREASSQAPTPAMNTPAPVPQTSPAVP